MDLKSIEYLKTGNTRQKKAYTLLKELKIIEYLESYDPVITGTIPIGIDLPESDLDIICECKKHTALLQFDTGIKIREMKPAEYAFLKEMLYQAIFVEDENTVLPRTIIDHPDLKKYIEDFGRYDDFCLVAEQNENLAGAIWIRRIKGYGFVDNETPELSMAVLKDHRGKGIGKRLLETMIACLTNGRFKKVSLSIDKANFAYGLHKKYGFVDYHSFEKSIRMIRKMIHT